MKDNINGIPYEQVFAIDALAFVLGDLADVFSAVSAEAGTFAVAD